MNDDVPEDQAREAAEEIAGFEFMRGELQVVKTDVASVKSDVASAKADIVALKTSAAVLKWMVGFNLTLSIATLGIVIQLLMRLPVVK